MEKAINSYTNEEIQKYCKQPEDITKDFVFQQTMYRIKDPRRSLPFYTEVLGMKLLQKLDFPAMKFSLYFMGYVQSLPDQPLGSAARTEWALSQSPTVELTHNWGTETDPNFQGYHTGNNEPKGYGHIGILVPEVNKACEYFEKHNIEFIKKPNDGKMKNLAFIKDPDGYWIEIFNNKIVSNY